MKIREAKTNDARQIGNLYFDTVRTINAKDYNENQIKVWSESGLEYKKWERIIADQYFIVAEEDEVISGFATLTKDGYLDFMYVHKNFQRKGVAKMLLEEIERKAEEQKNPEIYSHVSKTAKGFFEKHGFYFDGKLVDEFKGETFINNLMKKKLPA